MKLNFRVCLFKNEKKNSQIIRILKFLNGCEIQNKNSRVVLRIGYFDREEDEIENLRI